MSFPGTIQFPALAATPSPPPVGSYLLYTENDNTLRMEDSSGNVYIFGSTGFIETLTGDVTSGPVVSGSATTTVNSVGGQTAAAIAYAATQVAAATSADTPSTLVLRDASGNFSAGTITANLLGSSTSFTGSLSGDVTGTQSATMIASTVVTGKLLTGYVAGTNTPITATDTILQAFENLQAQVSASSGAAITALTGDVSAVGPGSAVATVNSVGGQTAAAIAYAATQVAAATSSNTASTLVLRDASGNFSANIITASLNGNATTSTSFTGSLSGDVTGTQSATKVVAIQNIAVNSTAPTDAQFLVYQTGITAYKAVSMSGDATMSDAGAITLLATAVTSKLLTGYVTGTNTPISATNSILTALENLQAQIGATVGAAITSLTGDVTATGPGAAVATVVAIQGHAVSSTAPTDAQILIWNSGTSKWTPESISGDISITDLGVASLIATTNSTITTLSALSLPGSQVTGNISGSAGNVTGVVAVLNGGTGETSFTANQPIIGGTTSTGPLQQVTTGTSGQVLQSNGSSAPTWTTNISGNAANITATTNSTLTTLTALSLPGSQVTGNISGNAANVTGVVAIVNGGTGQTTANAAFDALSPMTTLGDIIYENATPTAARLPGNTTAAREFLTSQGTGTSANAPSWSALVSGDIPNNAANTTGTAGNITATSNSTLTSLPNLTSAPSLTITGTQVGGFTPGSVIFAGASGQLSQDNANFYWNDTTLALGIGVQPASNAVLDIVNNSGATKAIQVTGYGSNVGFRGREAGGTLASPSATTSGTTLTFFSGRGYGATAFAVASTGVINIIADATFTDTSMPTHIGFNVTPVGSVTSVEAMRIANTGHVLIGTTTDGSQLLQVNGSALFSGIVTDSVAPIMSSLTGYMYANGASQVTASTTIPTSALSGTISLTTQVSGILPILNGGTGQTTANAAFAALSPMTTLGDIIYENATPAPARLGGNITTTREFLTSQGTGSTANAPSWSALVSGDIPNNAANTTGTASNITATSNTTLTSLPNLAITGSQVGGFTPGSVIFAGATGSLAQDNAEFFWDNTNFTLGLGTNTPVAASILTGLNTTGAARPIQLIGYGTGSSTGVRGDFARGTVGTPAAAQSGDTLNFISGRGYGASQFAAASTGVMQIVAGETFTNTSNATYIAFKTTPTGSVTSAERLRINSTGNILIGTTTDNATDLVQLNGGIISTYSKLAGSSSGYFEQLASATTTSYSITWPAAQGAAYSIPQNNGSGVLSWATLIAGTGISITNAAGSYTINNTQTTAIVTKTANYTILSTDGTILCDTSGGAFTLTLPSPTALAGKLYRIIDSTGFFQTNNLTLAPSGGEKIEGLAASKVLQTPWGWFTITTDGTNWFVG